MGSEKERFITEQYVPTGEPLSQNDHTIVYKVKCMAQPGKPDGIMKMYRKKNLASLYTRLKQLNYSEWPHIYDVKYFDENTLIVEEYLSGHTLAELMNHNKAKGVTFSEEEAYDIMDKLCEAIEQLSKLQPPIIHHNLKPSNIFITSTGTVKLLDFIPAYSKKKKPFGSLLNLLGAIFHEMLTGNSPKNGKCTYKGRYEPVIHKCIEKNPDRQYASMQQLHEDLDYAKTHKPEAAPLQAVGIPYFLTYPFQGTILAFEWILLSFFYTKDDWNTMCLFVVIFLFHSVIFALRRHAFMKENKVWLSTARKAFPVLLLAALLAGLFWVISFFFI